MTGVMWKTKNYLTKSSMKTIYNSLVYPHLQYGIIFWGATSTTNLDRIFRTQKKIVRIITGSNRFAHSEPLFKQLNLLKLIDIKHLETSKFIHKNLMGNNLLNFNQQDSHHYNTRGNHLLSLPQPRTNVLRNSFLYSGVKAYNELPANITDICTMPGFKMQLKFSLISQYFDQWH